MARTTGRFSLATQVGGGPSPWITTVGVSAFYKGEDGGVDLATIAGDAFFDSRPAFAQGASLASDSFTYTAGYLRGLGDWHATNSLWGYGSSKVSAAGTVVAATNGTHSDVISTATYRDGDYCLTWKAGAGTGYTSYLNILTTPTGATPGSTLGLGQETAGPPATFGVYTWFSGASGPSLAFPFTIADGDRIGIRVDGDRVFFHRQPGATGAWSCIGSMPLPYVTPGGAVALEVLSTTQDLDDLTITALYAPTGSNYTRTFTDTQASSDASTRTVAAARTTTDTAATTDAVSRSTTTIRVAADTQGSSDTTTRSTTTVRVAGDTQASADNLTRVRSSARTATDTQATSDTASRVVAATRTMLDTQAASSTAARAVAAAMTTADTVATSDTVASVRSASRTMLDTQASTDAAARGVTAARTAGDTQPASTTASRAAVLKRTASDTQPASTTSSRAMVLQRAAADTQAAADVFTYVYTPGGGSFTRTFQDTMTTTDTVTRIVVGSRTVASAQATVDALTRIVARVRAAGDTQTSSDAVSRSAAMTRVVTDTITASTIAFRRQAAARALGDIAPSASAITRIHAAARLFTDQQATVDVFTAVIAGAAPRTRFDHTIPVGAWSTTTPAAPGMSTSPSAAAITSSPDGWFDHTVPELVTA